MSSQALGSVSVTGRLVGLSAMSATVYLLYKFHQAVVTTKNGVPLPPGPPAGWLWDSVMPTVNVARTITHWISTYGPVITIREAGHITIIVGRVDAATELMEKEGSALADRPALIAANELLSMNLRILFLNSGERLRRLRKVIHSHLQPKAMGAYHGMQMDAARNMIVDILDDPENHIAHATRFGASVVLRMTYGKSTPTAHDDPEVIRIRKVGEPVLRTLRRGNYLVDRIPWLKHVPGYGRDLKKAHAIEMQLFREQMDRVESEMETNCAGDSFMKTLLEQIDEHQLSRDEMAHLAGELFGAGAATTAVGISHMIMAAARYPEAQQRVQEELDSVVGRNRLPTLEDSELLPQVHAFVLETHRWRPITPLGVPHCASRDIIWNGQWIPQGATVMGCNWTISRDPVAFPEPEKFDPQRWFDEDGRLRRDVTSFPYGYGRRACPGQHLANNSLYISLALLLWAFRVVERPDAPIDTHYSGDTIVTLVAPFDVEFVPRADVSWLKEILMSDST